MFEDKKSLIDLVPDSVDNAVKNITDKPTQNMGTTLADIWYLVFGGISQAAEKRKLKYSYALQEFENELQEKISKIPKDKIIEPDIQIVAPALEASKYCVQNKELRTLFSNYISSSMNFDTADFSQPIFIDILKNLKSFDCQILNGIFQNARIEIFVKQSNNMFHDLVLQIQLILNKLNSYGLINFECEHNNTADTKKAEFMKYIINNDINKIITNCYSFCEFGEIKEFLFSGYNKKDNSISFKINFDKLSITPLGIAFKIICIG